MGCKAVETTGNINSAFGQETANNHTVRWWFKKFCKGDESLEDEEHSGRPSEGDNHQLREIIRADPLKTTREVAEELSADHPAVIWHWKQIGKVKKLDKWVPYELTTNQKNHSFCCLLLIYTTVNHFSMRLRGVTKNGLYTTTSDDQLSG